MVIQRNLSEQEDLKTGRKIFLASMEDSHVKHLIKLAQDPNLPNLVGWDTFFELDETEQFIEAISSLGFSYSRKSQPLVFGIYLNPEDFPIGYTVLKGLNTELLTTEIGVAILDKKYRNQGYGTLALKQLINYAFDELNIQKIGAVILCSNKISTNVFEKSGFVVREVAYKSWQMPNGELADMVLMELTNPVGKE